MTFSKVWFKDLFSFPTRSLYDAPVKPAVAEARLALSPVPSPSAERVGVSVVMPSRGTKPRALALAVASVWAQEPPSAAHEVPQEWALQVILRLDGPEAPWPPDAVSEGVSPWPPDVVSEGVPPWPPDAVSEGVSGGSGEAAALTAVELTALKDPRLVVVRRERASGGRPGLVRNRAMTEATGDLVSVLLSCCPSPRACFAGLPLTLLLLVALILISRADCLFGRRRLVGSLEASPSVGCAPWQRRLYELHGDSR
jgi:hypothetical protein